MSSVTCSAIQPGGQVGEVFGDPGLIREMVGLGLNLEALK